MISMKNMYSMKSMKGVNEESMKIKANIVVGENGEITLPEDFLRTFKLSPGDKLIVLGDENARIAMKKYDFVLYKALNLLAEMGLIERRMEE